MIQTTSLTLMTVSTTARPLLSNIICLNIFSNHKCKCKNKNNTHLPYSQVNMLITEWPWGSDRSNKNETANWLSEDAPYLYLVLDQYQIKWDSLFSSVTSGEIRDSISKQSMAVVNPHLSSSPNNLIHWNYCQVMVWSHCWVPTIVNLQTLCLNSEHCECTCW